MNVYSGFVTILCAIPQRVSFACLALICISEGQHTAWKSRVLEQDRSLFCFGVQTNAWVTAKCISVWLKVYFQFEFCFGKKDSRNHLLSERETTIPQPRNNNHVNYRFWISWYCRTHCSRHSTSTWSSRAFLDINAGSEVSFDHSSHERRTKQKICIGDRDFDMQFDSGSLTRLLARSGFVL